jgi:hypothetical protein
MNGLARRVVTIAAATAALLVVMVAPVSAGGATQIGGTGGVHAVGEFTDDCPDPGGEYSEFIWITLKLETGNLQGCWYTLVEEYSFSPNADATPVVYHERGREVFVGDLYDDNGNWMGGGTFETTYHFTGKFEDASQAVEIHGRCQHPLAAGTGTGVFGGMTGRVDFKDNVETGVLTYRGHLM